MAEEDSIAAITTHSPSEVSIDEALESIAPTCRFQILLQITMFYVVMTTTYNFIFSVFSGEDSPWRCVSSNSSQFCKQHYNKSIHSYNEHFNERCKMKRSDWTFTTEKHHSFVTEFELVCEKTSYAAMVSASYYIGGFLGTSFSGIVGDRYGRKPVLLLSLSTLICFSIGCSFVTTIVQLTCLNILRGASNVACYYTIFVYISEYSIPRFRAISNSQLMIAGPTSFLLIDLVAYYERRWRNLQLYAALPAIPGLIALFLLPESVRWLHATGKIEQATAILERIKLNGNAKANSIRLKYPKNIKEKKYNYLDLVRNLKVFKLTSSVAFLWFAITLVFYTIALGTSNLGGNMYEAFALSTLVDYLGAIACALLLNKVGRKKMVLGGLFTTGLLMGSMSLIPRSLSCRYTINLVLSLVGRFAACIAFDAMFTWTFELFPTVVRSQGMSVSVVFERLGMFCCPFITRLLQNISSLLPLIIMCVVAILASICGLVLPETNNQPTREQYQDFFEMKAITPSSGDGIDNCAFDMGFPRNRLSTHKT